MLPPRQKRLRELTTRQVAEYYSAGTTRIAMRKNGTLYCLLSNHASTRLSTSLGSTRFTTNASGNVLSELRSREASLWDKPWGETRYAGGNTATKYQYTGQFSYESDFGLYFYNARWYDPALGRFAQADTLVPAGVQGLDRYAYVNNVPTRFTDPSGHDPQCGPDGIFCDPSASFEEVYGITFTGEMENWIAKNIAAAKASVSAVAKKLCSVMRNCTNSAFAFNVVYGNGVEFEWKTDCYYCRSQETIDRCGNNFSGDCVAGGAVTLDKDHIMISSLSSHSNPIRDFVRRRNNIVHELGHAFDLIMSRSPRGAVGTDWQNLQRGDTQICLMDLLVVQMLEIGNRILLMSHMRFLQICF